MKANHAHNHRRLETVGLIQAWLLSLLVHAAVVLGAVGVFSSLEAPPQQEVFRWDIALVEEQPSSDPSSEGSDERVQEEMSQDRTAGAHIVTQLVEAAVPRVVDRRVETREVRPTPVHKTTRVVQRAVSDQDTGRQVTARNTQAVHVAVPRRQRIAEVPRRTWPVSSEPRLLSPQPPSRHSLTEPKPRTVAERTSAKTLTPAAATIVAHQASALSQIQATSGKPPTVIQDQSESARRVTAKQQQAVSRKGAAPKEISISPQRVSQTNARTLSDRAPAKAVRTRSTGNVTNSAPQEIVAAVDVSRAVVEQSSVQVQHINVALTRSKPSTVVAHRSASQGKQVSSTGTRRKTASIATAGVSTVRARSALRGAEHVRVKATDLDVTSNVGGGEGLRVVDDASRVPTVQTASPSVTVATRGPPKARETESVTRVDAQDVMRGVIARIAAMPRVPVREPARVSTSRGTRLVEDPVESLTRTEVRKESHIQIAATQLRSIDEALSAETIKSTSQGQPATLRSRTGPREKMDFGWLARHMFQKVARYKRYPFPATVNRLEGKVVLRAVIQADGHLAEVTVKRSSGHPILDKDAMDLVREVCPLVLEHPLGRPQIVMHIPITYTLTH